jgi:hypothetical protein
VIWTGGHGIIAAGSKLRVVIASTVLDVGIHPLGPEPVVCRIARIERNSLTVYDELRVLGVEVVARLLDGVFI